MQEGEREVSLAHSNLGLVYARLGQMDEAALHFEAAVRIRPDNEVANAALSRLRITSNSNSARPAP